MRRLQNYMLPLHKTAKQ